ncbi:MAG: integrase DNA-binding domain-containing protein [Blautia sp.]
MYSWRLVKNDTVPQETKDDISLRDKEKLIHKGLEDDIISDSKKITVLELVKKYVSQKTGTNLFRICK